MNTFILGGPVESYVGDSKVVPISIVFIGEHFLDAQIAVIRIENV